MNKPIGLMIIPILNFLGCFVILFFFFQYFFLQYGYGLFTYTFISYYSIISILYTIYAALGMISSILVLNSKEGKIWYLSMCTSIYGLIFPLAIITVPWLLFYSRFSTSSMNQLLGNYQTLGIATAYLALDIMILTINITSIVFNSIVIAYLLKKSTKDYFDV